MRTTKAAIVCLQIVACSDELQPEVRSEAPGVSMARTDDGIELLALDNGDGTYSYALDPEFDPNSLVEEGAAVWQYDRQARFAFQAEEWGEQTYVVSDRNTDTALDRAYRRIRVDDQGRRWTVFDINVAAWEANIAAADAKLLPVGEDLQFNEPQGEFEPEPDPEPGTIVSWTPHSWTTGCTLNDDDIWDGESRVAVTDPVERQLTSVSVLDEVKNSHCSGVLLTATEVLTAAHCVTTVVVSGQDTTLNPVNVSICAHGNNTGTSPGCAPAVDVDISDEFDRTSTSDTDHNDDWAIVEFVGFGGGVDDMDMSNLSTLGSRDIFSLGYPAQIPTSCVGNFVSSGDESTWSGVTMFRQSGVNVTDFDGEDAKGKYDAMGGQSGSPVYHCGGDQDDACEAGETGIVDWVHTGDTTTAFGLRMVGPRVPNFRTEALVFIND